MNLPSVGESKLPWLKRIRRWDWSIVGLVVAIKVLIFTFAVECLTTRAQAYAGWKEIWNRWDAVHYLRLAEQGYVATGDERFSLVFYPLFPWLVRLVAAVVPDYLSAAFVVSGLASIAATVLLYHLVRLDESKTVARHAAWFLLIFPTSYFLHIGYTESLFLALTLGCVFAARSELWWMAGLLGAGACLTRVNGLLLGPVLVLEAFEQFRRMRRIDPCWLWIGVVPFGFLGYLWLNHHVTGDFFAFSRIMEQHWFKKFTPPWVGIYGVLSRLPGDQIEGLHELVYIVFGLICVFWSWARLRPSYALWITSNWLLITSTSFVLSVPRYLLTFFPVFILLAQLCTGRRLLFGIVTVFSLLYLGLYASRFTQGLWAF